MKVLGFKEIKNLLPRRYPLLMLDRAALDGEGGATAVKNLSMNELFFQGHFPNHPIMPGVLQVEAMKQLSEILALELLGSSEEQDIYLRRLAKVKFRKPNTPGDRIKIESKVISSNGNEVEFKCSTSNAAGITCEAVLTLASRSTAVEMTMPELYNEFDKGVETAMDIGKIMELMPHRYPFLLIDNIARVDGDHVIAIKNVTGNEEFFAHCNADYAVMPESLLCEIVAQSGCASVLSRPENKGKIGYFMSIDSAEFMAPVFPGDQLLCDIELPAAKSRFGKGTGILRIGDKIVLKITLMFAIVDA